MKWLKYGLSFAAIIFLGALFIYNTSGDATDKHHLDEPWQAGMLEGSPDAPHKLIEYTDYFCQFCADFREQASSDEFREQYLNTGKVSLESRVNAILQGNSPNSEPGGEAAFCAADQGKFAEYTDHIIPRIKKDYFEKGIGVKILNGQPLSEVKPIAKLPLSYFTESAEATGLDVGKFNSCMTNHDFLDDVKANTSRAIGLGVTGLPFVVIDDYQASGFDGGWRGFELMLRRGGVTTD